LYKSNIVWLLGEKLLRLLLSFTVSILLIRYLGPDRFGYLSYAQNVVFVCAAIAGLGMDSVIVRMLVDSKNIRNILYNAFILRFSFSLFMFVLCSVFAFYTFEMPLLIIIIAISLFFQSALVFDFFFQSIVKSKYTAQSSLIASLVVSLLKVIAIYFDLGLELICLVILLEYVVLALLLLYSYIKTQKNLEVPAYCLHVDFSLMKEILTSSLPLLIANVCYVLYAKIDQMMVLNILGAKDAGVFSASVKLSEIWFFIPAIVASTFFPLIIQTLKSDEICCIYLMKKLYSAFFWLGVTITCLIIFSADFIILSLFGIEYSESAAVLKIQIASLSFIFLGVISSKWIVANNKPMLSLWRNLFGLIINIYLNYILIEKYGILGAAFASFIAYFCAYMVSDVFTPFGRTMLKHKISAILFINIFPKKDRTG